MPMTKLQKEQHRLVLLRRYRQQLINQGICEDLANAAFRIWKRGVQRQRDALILDRIEELLAMPASRRLAA
jgi:hypothetical protein